MKKSGFNSTQKRKNFIFQQKWKIWKNWKSFKIRFISPCQYIQKKSSNTLVFNEVYIFFASENCDTQSPKELFRKHFFIQNFTCFWLWFFGVKLSLVYKIVSLWIQKNIFLALFNICWFLVDFGGNFYKPWFLLFFKKFGELDPPKFQFFQNKIKLGPEKHLKSQNNILYHFLKNIFFGGRRNFCTFFCP